MDIVSECCNETYVEVMDYKRKGGKWWNEWAREDTDVHIETSWISSPFSSDFLYFGKVSDKIIDGTTLSKMRINAHLKAFLSVITVK